MSIQADGPDSSGKAAPAVLSYTLITLAFLAPLSALIGLVAWLVLLRIRQELVSPSQALLLAALLAAGVGVCGFLLAAEAVIRALRRLAELTAAIDQRTAVLAEQSVARSHERSPLPQQSAAELAELKNLLLELRETFLLPADQRDRRYKILVEREFRRRLAAVDRFIASGEFHRARAEVDLLMERFGDDPRAAGAKADIDLAAERARADDLAAAASRVESLMGLMRWPEAEQVALELAQRYPNLAEPVGLVGRVRRERQIFEQRHRQRLHEEIQQFVSHRRWRDSAHAAHEFITTFPAGPDTDALRAQMDTLEANAEIETRQNLERELKVLLQQHRHWDALALARRIIAEYPLSPQANALRRQIQRLEELARQHEPQSDTQPAAP